ncbi:MAG TPA: ATP-binding cassette domain-containing protein [Actinospica sp.]|nr:ATP-binding cassette domain-containing protein [Actinospica sp.]
MIEAVNLTKAYRGTRAIDGVGFTAPAGRITGLVGPNGAGKSTVMRLLLGLERPDDGRALINGRPFTESANPAREVGALLDAAWAHPGRSAQSHLRMLALAGGLPRRRVDEVLELVELQAVRRGRAGTYSLGMLQRLGIATALLGEPRVLILDEPTNGLDPTGIRWLRDVLRGLRDDGVTVLISSHLLSELQQIADRVVLLDRGRLLVEDDLGPLLARHAVQGFRVLVRRRPRLLALLRGAGAEVTDAPDNGSGDGSGSGSGAVLVTGIGIERLSDLLAENDLRPHELTPIALSLDDVYATLLGLRDE